MCDYSLMGVPNRLAVAAEELVVHRFRTGSLGLAAPLDLEPTSVPTEHPKSLWTRLKLFFNPPEKQSVRAVCIPPGARLVLEGIPHPLQHALGVGPIELVTFTQVTASGRISGQFEAAGSYRDAVHFKNGREVRLQDLCEGQRMWVMDLSGPDSSEPVREAITRV
jgi:hypothetical protein